MQTIAVVTAVIMGMTALTVALAWLVVMLGTAREIDLTSKVETK